MENTQMAKPKASPKDFFLHVGAIATLYYGIFNFLTIAFRIIDVKFPDNLERYFDPYSSDLRFAIASLIVIYPVHMVLMRLLNKDYIERPESREYPIRKWLVYFTLFVAGATIMGSLIAMLNNFLGGELTTRFIFKAITILAVSVAVFWYYIADLKRSGGLSKQAMNLFAAAVGVLIVGTIAYGFVVMGSPAKMRDYRFDAQRINDLQNIQYQILSFWQNKEKLPANLDELKDPLSGNFIPTDPATKEQYEYAATGATSFRLCANFNLKSDEVTGTPYGMGGGFGISRPMMDVAMPIGPEQENWKHEAGKACFDRTIDPDRYPPVNKPLR